MNISVSEAKANFADLLKRAENGETIIITRHGKPVARVEAYQGQTKGVRIGAFKGEIWMSDDFEAPLDDFKDYQ